MTKKLRKSAQEIASEALAFKSKEYYKVNQMNETNTVNHEALVQIASLPQLTIPKRVADYHEKIEWHMNLVNKDWKKSKPTEEEKREQWAWREEGKNEHIYQIFLASKALGIDLVKIVDSKGTEYPR